MFIGNNTNCERNVERGRRDVIDYTKVNDPHTKGKVNDPHTKGEVVDCDGEI